MKAKSIIYLSCAVVLLVLTLIILYVRENYTLSKPRTIALLLAIISIIGSIILFIKFSMTFHN
jgi:hypothetical protein